jgi:hypothetical protein
MLEKVSELKALKCCAYPRRSHISVSLLMYCISRALRISTTRPAEISFADIQKGHYQQDFDELLKLAWDKSITLIVGFENVESTYTSLTNWQMMFSGMKMCHTEWYGSCASCRRL